ncbi:MAG: hypothetical protein RLZZ538_1469 [Actinomycetota bacterium]
MKEAVPTRPAAAQAPRSSSASARPSSSNKSPQASTSRASAQSAVNSVEQFEAFAAKHAIGARVKGVVESFASHGAYVRIGEVAGYLPVRLMKSPAPRTPREQVKIGDPLTLSVSDFNQSRRSIEVSLMPVEKPAASKAAKPAKRLPVARVLKRRRRRD